MKNLNVSNTEFVTNPSEITKKLVEIVLKLSDKYESELKKNVFKKFINQVKLRLYLKQGYLEYYSFLKKYKLKDLDLKELFDEFEKLYDKLIFNNFALAYAFVLEKDVKSPILTKEDEKILFLKKLYDKKITKKQFDKEFGHYALNAYELSSKRFEEYSDEELMKIARLTKNIKINKIKLEDYTDKKVIPVLIALRELAKYNILFIVKEIRYKLLRIAKKNNIKNVFDESYSKIITSD